MGEDSLPKSLVALRGFEPRHESPAFKTPTTNEAPVSETGIQTTVQRPDVSIPANEPLATSGSRAQVLRAYHWLCDDMRAGSGNEAAWTEGEERTIEGRLVICNRGYHSSPTPWDGLSYAQGNVLCLVEISKPEAQESDKYVSRTRKLIKAINVEHELRAFACDVAEETLHRERELGREPDERSWAAIAVARRYNAGEASKEELAAAGGAAWVAARNAARNAAWDAAGGAARHAARNAAGGAARDAAWDAAGGAARGAAWDAAGGAARGAARNAAWAAAGGAAWAAAGGAARAAAGAAAWDAAWDAAGAALKARFNARFEALFVLAVAS